MITIKFTIEQCRFVADVIRHRPTAEVGKLAIELSKKVLDALANNAEVEIETTPQMIDYIYPLINDIGGEIDFIRTAMKQSLMVQIMTNMSIEPPIPTAEDLEDPDFVPLQRQGNEWDVLAGLIMEKRGIYDERAQMRLDNGKNFLQSLR